MNNYGYYTREDYLKDSCIVIYFGSRTKKRISNVSLFKALG